MAVRRGVYLYATAAEWERTNPKLKRGQLAIEVPSNRMKTGNGRDPWTALEFINVEPAPPIDVLDGGRPGR